MSCPITTNMCQFDGHSVCIATTTRSDKKVYPSLWLFSTPLSAGALAPCSTSYPSFLPSHLQLPNHLMYPAGHAKEMQNKNLGGFMPVIHVLWYLDKFVVDSGNIDVVVVVDETTAMAAKIAMSDGRTKVAFLAVSAIRQKDLSSAVGGALQDAIIMQYMLDNDQMEDGITCAHWDTQEHWLSRGIRLWVWDSDRGHQGHQKEHAAEAAQEHDVSEAPVDDGESASPTLPRLTKTAQVVPTRCTAQEKEPPQVARSREMKKERNRTRREKQTMRMPMRRMKKRMESK